MGATKTDLFSIDDNGLAIMAKAIAHPARIAILRKLIKINSSNCGDLVEALGLAQPTVSQHLKELKNAGLIKGTADGVSVNYSINPEVWNLYRGLFLSFFIELTPDS